MQFEATLVENRPLTRHPKDAGGVAAANSPSAPRSALRGGDSFVLALSGCGALADAKPGQFVMVRADWGRDPLLPRAFSILRVTPDGGAELLVKAVGRGTRLLEQLEPGARLFLLGPLGRPFPEPEPGRHDLLVAGGVGLAPLLWHAEVARARGASCELFYGARSAADLVLLDEIARSGARLHLATEDGSSPAGQSVQTGRVTAALEKRLADGSIGTDSAKSSVVLTCGPNPMMRAVAELARARSLRCLVSVEGEMACGIGACLGCALPLVGQSRPFGYACVDGPVFDATQVVIP